MTTLDRREAFVELHSRPLHGFALLVTLGDEARAGRLAAEALQRGADRVEELRHPERAAAWLRGELVRAAGGPAWGQRRPSDGERREALRRMGVDGAVFDALATLDRRGRAAIVGGAIEELAAADVAHIVGGDDRVHRARRDYLAAYRVALRARGEAPVAGPLWHRVQAMAAPVRPRSA